MLPHIQGPPLRLETTIAKEITLSTIARMVSPAMRAEGWSVSIYDYITSTEAGQWMGPTPVVMSWDTIMNPQIGSRCMLLRGKLRHHLPMSLVSLETPRMETAVGMRLVMIRIRRNRRTMMLKRSLTRTARALLLKQCWKQRRTKKPWMWLRKFPLHMLQ